MARKSCQVSRGNPATASASCQAWVIALPLRGGPNAVVKHRSGDHLVPTRARGGSCLALRPLLGDQRGDDVLAHWHHAS
jgi:hypothetical protein